MKILNLPGCLAILLLLGFPGTLMHAQNYRFDFGNGDVENGYMQITDTTFYKKHLGYGLYVPGESKSVRSVVYSGINNGSAISNDHIAADNPFYLVLDLPEGNYRVTVRTGDRDSISHTSVKAESRRLFLLNQETSRGKIQEAVFNVQVRTPKINKEEAIHLKPREKNYLNWDQQMHIEFNGNRPCINSVEVEPIENVTTVFLTGNSTVVDQEVEPWASWGQMITYFFDTSVVVANYAESGEALKSFVAENRLTKVLSQIKPGDYMFIEFGHNDQKPQSSAYLEANSGFKEYLKMFIDSARRYGAHPVLVTSTQRRNFDESGNIINTHGDYPEAVREVGEEEQVPVIDLTRMSTRLYEALGVEGSKNAFVHYPAGTFPGQEKDLADNSHFNNYGAFQLAKCVVKGIKEHVPDLSGLLKDEIPPYDPRYPDDPKTFIFPESPVYQLTKPDGN